MGSGAVVVCQRVMGAASDASGGVVVTYNLSIELVVPLPGFVKRRAEVRILNTVKELKVRAESAQ